MFFLFFWSFPLVEGPHSDIFSRTRFSVFLRISFGVSSSSSSSSSSISQPGLHTGLRRSATILHHLCWCIVIFLIVFNWVSLRGPRGARRVGLHRRQQDAGVFASVAKLRRCEGLIVYKSGLIWFQNRNSSVCQKAFSYVQESPELYYRQHFLAGPGWLRLHFDYRLPFSMISGWLRLPPQTTDYTCTIKQQNARTIALLAWF